MIENVNLKEMKETLESSVILENEKLIKVMVAIDSSENKKMTDVEIMELTKLDNSTASYSIELLNKADYISVSVEDVPNMSIHKICQLTKKGEKLLKMLKIE